MADRSLALLRWLSTQEPVLVLLGCEHSTLPPVPPEAVGARIAGCLTDADISLPAQLLASGVPTIAVVDCPVRAEEVRRRVDGWTRILHDVVIAPVRTEGEPRRRTLRLRGLRRPGPTYDSSQAPAAGAAVSRRTLFGLAGHDAPPLDLSQDETTRGLAALRLLAEQGRARLGAPATPAGRAPAPPPADRATPAGRDPAPPPAETVAVSLRVDDCVACGVCVQACPHGALALADDGSESVLRHQPDRCRGEQECVRLCPAGVLTVAGDLSLLDLASAPLVELARVETSRCDRCGARHPTRDGDLCTTCAFRAAHPFGSALPTPMGR